MKHRCSSSAFTIIEMLMAVTVLGLLVGVSGAAYQKALSQNALTAELNAGKNLIQAYLLSASENSGRYLPAYDLRARNETVLNARGRPVSMNEIKYRYPFRLAPYFNYQMDDTILVNQNESQIIRQMGASGTMYDYGLSIFPAMGINRYLVGGSVNRSGVADHDAECIQTFGDGGKSVVVFVSAGTDGIDGYEYVIAPQGPRGRWSSARWDKDSDPADYGHVSARFDGKAVVAFLDGSVKAMSIEELRDMRLWSKNAALANDPNYQPR